MKTLIVFYSLDWNTKLISDEIARETWADILELKPKKDISNKNFMKYIWWWRQVVMKEKPELYPFDKNPLDYDVIFIGTPVWAFNFVPAFRTFFENVKLSGKKIAIFCCHEWWKWKTLENMKEELNWNEIIWENDFEKVLKGNKEECLKKAIFWAKSLV